MAIKLSIDRKNAIRAILTDTLPYETPLFFSNEKLYIEASSSFVGLPSFVRRIISSDDPTKPASYKIQKGGGSFRLISVPHPGAQLRLARFYGEFDSYIQSACARSSYSLRFPSRVGSHYFQQQYHDPEEIGAEMSDVDMDPASQLPQRRWASTYFSYRRYSQIFKFFQSEEFTQLEQKNRFMLKLDIARCFESIYTHSIAWAVRGKSFAKDHRDRNFFESEFDRHMRNANWGETSGIPIGPEVSRIFAEIIMQSIDLAVERSLSGDLKDVVVRRYVDDYFVFGNSEEKLGEVKSVIERCAAEYNLHLNERKTETIHRPFVSKLSVARSQAIKSISEFMTKARDGLGDDHVSHLSGRDVDLLISRLREIAASNDTDYSSVASPCLAVIWRALSRIRRRVSAGSFSDKAGWTDVVDAVLRVSSFLYQMDIRATTTHKLAKLLYEASLITAKVGASKKTFEGQVEDIVRSSLDISSKTGIHGPEIVNLLVAADAVCNDGRFISPEMVGRAIGFDFSKSNGRVTLSYFDLVSSLYFAKNFVSFSQVREVACQEIERRLRSFGSKLHVQAEAAMLFFDFVSCPYVDQNRRFKLFSDVAGYYGEGVPEATLRSQFRKTMRRLNFVTWEGSAQLRALLERRELQPAYDS